VKRREFITVLGGAAAAWPLVAHAQQPKVSRIGWLTTADWIRPLIVRPPNCNVAGCACRKSNPNILVVQPAQDRRFLKSND